MMLSHLSYSLFVGVLATSLCAGLLKPVATHVGLVDMPGGRKTHVDSVPLIGGIIIFIGFCFTLLTLDISLRFYRGLLAGGAILILIGVVDDFRELTPSTRFIGQILAALCLVHWGHLYVLHLGNLFFLGNVNLGMTSSFVTVLAVLALINAMNMIDGLDGLAAVIACSEIILFILINIHLFFSDDVYVLIVLLTVLSVFLCYNFPFPWRKRAHIFLGDAGSTFIGFAIAWFAVSLSQRMIFNHYYLQTFNPITVLWILAYPLFDLISVIVLRFKARKPLFTAARDHLHHLLLAKGLRSMNVLFLILGISLSFGLIGILLAYLQVSESWQTIFYFASLIAYVIFCQLLCQQDTLAYEHVSDY